MRLQEKQSNSIGDYFHASPEIYNENDFLPQFQKTAGEIWKHDKERLDEIEKTGIKIKILWEHEKINEKLIEELAGWFFTFDK